MFTDTQCGHGVCGYDGFEFQSGHGLAGFEGLQYQNGHGLAGFDGTQFQYGNGAFGTIAKYAKPILKYLGRKALELVGGVANDVVSGDTIKESAKKRIKQTALDVTERGGEELQNLTKKGLQKTMKFIAQRGSGKRRRRRKTVLCVKVKKAGLKRRRLVKRYRGRPRKHKRPSRNRKSKTQFDFLQ